MMAEDASPAAPGRAAYALSSGGSKLRLMNDPSLSDAAGDASKSGTKHAFHFSSSFKTVNWSADTQSERLRSLKWTFQPNFFWLEVGPWNVLHSSTNLVGKWSHV